jgi:3-hydroxymyristoyl/3-hydroxydecanoyl-(acyl carrier protein) dehydratase
MSATTHRVAADHPMLPGHFPGQPIVPGAWLLAQVLDDAAQWLAVQGRVAQVCGVKSIKFLQPVLPEQSFAIEFSEGSGTLKFTLTLGDARAATGVLELASD